MTESRSADGIVSQWDAENGIGAIKSAGTPGGCFVHCSNIDAVGRTQLHAGEPVRFAYEAAEQDGYRFRATSVRIPGVPQAEPPQPSDAYSSSLTIVFDKPPD
jgi:CspA family cold shock protein